MKKLIGSALCALAFMAGNMHAEPVIIMEAEVHPMFSLETTPVPLGETNLAETSIPAGTTVLTLLVNSNYERNWQVTIDLEYGNENGAVLTREETHGDAPDDTATMNTSFAPVGLAVGMPTGVLGDNLMPLPPGPLLFDTDGITMIYHDLAPGTTAVGSATLDYLIPVELADEIAADPTRLQGVYRERGEVTISLI